MGKPGNSGWVMRSGWRKVIGVLAIYAVAMHVVLAGLMPVAALATSSDPLSVICHSVPSGAAGQQDPGVPQPGHACEHCNLCTTLAPPPPPDTPLAANLVPARVLHVLRPLSTSARTALASDPKLARGPPQAM
jgi:hypothetical protein